MKKMICPSCGQLIYGKREYCPYCNQPLMMGNPYNKKKRRIKGSIGVVLGIAFLAFALFVGSYFWRTKSAVKEEKALDMDVLLKQMEEDDAESENEPDADLAEKEIEKSARKAVDAYNSGTLSYSEAIKKVEGLHEKYPEDSWGYETMVAVLNKLKESKQSYELGASFEKNKEYANAYEQYGKVINEDAEYEKAKESKKRVKKAMDEQEKEKDKKFELKKNKVIKTDYIIATFVDASFTNAIKPDNTKESYQYYKTKDSSTIWLDLKFTIKNHSKEEFDLGTMLSDVQVFVKGEHLTCKYGAYSSSGKKLDFVGISGALKAGKQVTYHFIIELPKKLKTSKDSLEVKFYIDGEKQDLKYR